jgi:serine/threonine-protein kinase/endoribonuclease IRE1
MCEVLSNEGDDRPAAETILLHPFFWTPDRRLRFVCDASDRFEVMERDPPEKALIDLESDAATVVGVDWHRAIDRALLDNLGKYRRYDAGSVRDLLRVLRNKVRGTPYFVATWS